MNLVLEKKHTIFNIKIENLYFYLMLFFAFSMPLSRASISLCVLLFVSLWIYEGDFKNKFQKIKTSKLLVSFSLLYFLILFSLLYSSDFSLALKFVRLYLYWLLIFIIALNLKKEYINKIITAFLFGMFISEFIAYGVILDLWEFGIATKQTPSPFMMHIDYSIFLAVTSIILFNRLLQKDYTFKEKLAIFLFFLSTTGNLFLSTGRTGQIALIFAIIVMFFYNFRFKIRTFIFILLSLLSIYLLAFNLSDSFNHRMKMIQKDFSHLNSGNFNTSIGIRIAYWIVSYDIFKNNPLIGVGAGDYSLAINETLDKKEFGSFANAKEFMSKNHAHNQFLMIIIQLGLLGLLLVLYIFYLLLRTILKIENKEHKAILLLFVVIYLASCFTDPLWYKQFTIAIWILFISFITYYELETN